MVRGQRRRDHWYLILERGVPKSNTLPGAYARYRLGSGFGDTVDHERDKLGYGAESSIWLGFKNDAPGIPLAFKFLRNEDSYVVVELFRKCQKIRHQHFLQFHELIDLEDEQGVIPAGWPRYCMVTEKADLTLRDYLIEQLRITVDEAADVVRQLLEGLAFLHDKVNVIHCDIQASNIFLNLRAVSEFPELLIADIGIFADSEGRQLQFGTGPKKYQYLADESVWKSKKADLHAAAVMIEDILNHVPRSDPISGESRLIELPENQLLGWLYKVRDSFLLDHRYRDLGFHAFTDAKDALVNYPDKSFGRREKIEERTSYWQTLRLEIGSSRSVRIISTFLTDLIRSEDARALVPNDVQSDPQIGEFINWLGGEHDVAWTLDLLHPDSLYCSIRDADMGKQEGTVSKLCEASLCTALEEFSGEGKSGHIDIRVYTSAPPFFSVRSDDSLWVTNYPFGDTVTTATKLRCSSNTVFADFIQNTSDVIAGRNEDTENLTFTLHEYGYTRTLSCMCGQEHSLPYLGRRPNSSEKQFSIRDGSPYAPLRQHKPNYVLVSGRECCEELASTIRRSFSAKAVRNARKLHSVLSSARRKYGKSIEYTDFRAFAWSDIE